MINRQKDPAIKLRKVFIMALALIGLMTVLLQLYISYEVISPGQSTFLINDSGKQRMLSQRIESRLSILLYEKNDLKRIQYFSTIQDDLEQIQITHNRLVANQVFKNQTELLTQNIQIFGQLETIVDKALVLLDLPKENNSQLKKLVGDYFVKEQQYIDLINKITTITEKQVEQRFINFLWYSWGGVFIVLLSLLFSVWKVLLPSLKVMTAVFKKQENENKQLEEAKQLSEKNELAVGEQAIEMMVQKQLSDAILNTTQAVIISIDIKGCVSVFNKAAEELFGYEWHEIKGKNIKQLMPNPYQDQHDGFLANYLRTGERKIIDLEREVMGQRRDGSTFPMNLRVKEINLQGRHEFIGFVEDLTLKKQAENAAKALVESERRYLSVADDQENLICRYDENFILSFVNKAYCEHELKSREELLESSLLNNLASEVVTWVLASHQLITWDEPIQQHEDKFIQPGGSEEWQAWTTRGIFDENDKLIEYQGVGTISTHRKKAEFDLLQAKNSAEEANKAKSLFLSNMSHELRTPLNAIIGFSQFLETDEDDPLTEEQRESVKFIQQGGQHLLMLINDILDLSAIEAGKVNLSIETIIFDDIFREVEPFLSDMAAKRNISIKLKKTCTNDRVMTDYMRTKQVVLNLLSNAIKYNNENGHIDVEVSNTEAYLHVAIKDTGPGLSEEQQKSLFTPFNRAGAEYTAIEGTGIGLSLCKGIITQLQGEIGVESEQGVGSNFWFTLPLATGDGFVEQLKIESDRKEEAEIPVKSKVLLYIEDNPANIKLMRKVIKKLPDFTLLEAPDAEIGLEMMAHNKPDAVLLDIDLPGMNGYEAFTEMQKRFDFADTLPVIAVSANAMVSDVEKGKAFGFYDYLTKPLKIPLLLEVMTGALSEISQDK